MNMGYKILPIIFVLVCVFSCDTKKQRTKSEQIQYVIKESGFIKLPLEFDASIETALEGRYSVNRASDDTLLFESGIRDIIGFLPDTTNFYAFLHLTIGDMLYPTIVTMDKSWQKIDEKFICTGGCAGHAQLDVISCYDSVFVYKDLSIKAISKVIGTVEVYRDSTSEIFDICNMVIVDGFIDKNGRISINKSGLIDCSE